MTDFYLSAVLATLELVRSEISVLSGEIALLKITMQSQPKVVIDADLIKRLVDGNPKRNTKT